MQKRIVTQTHVRRLVMDAMFIALYVVFEQLSVEMAVVEISLTSLPILLCARLYGLRDALAVALIGSFVEQLTSPYGLSVTTPLWMAPVILMAACAAILFWLLGRRGGRLRLLFVIILSELVFTVLNTAALYLDGYIMDYAVKALHLMVMPRLLNCLVRMAVSCILLPLLLPKLERLTGQKNNKN